MPQQKRARTQYQAPTGNLQREVDTTATSTDGVTWVRAGYWSNVILRSEQDSTARHSSSHQLPACGGPLEPAPQQAETCNMRRERENLDCIGGMRTPWRTLRRCPVMRAAGEVLAEILDKVAQAEPSWLHLVDKLGSHDFAVRGSDSERSLQESVSRLQCAIKCGLSYSFTRNSCPRSLWQADIAEAWSLRAVDPDKEFIRWLSDGCPLGVASPILAGGVFPHSNSSEQQPGPEDLLMLAEPGENYRSVNEAAAKAGAELDRAVGLGYAEHFESWESARRTHGKLLVSKLACLVKTRPDGSEKVRLVVDLRRSGYNACVQLEERIVLPRLKDLVSDTLDLEAELNRSRGESVYFMCADFEDAFHSLGVHASEFPFLCVRHPVSGFVVYHTVMFGGAGSPLVWGRAAAFIGRSTQSLLVRGRTEVYVDDPCLVLAGTGDEARRLATRALMWWLALGLRISWPKGVFKQSVTWIGACISARQPDRVTVAVPEKYAKEMVDLLRTVHLVDASVSQRENFPSLLPSSPSFGPTQRASGPRCGTLSRLSVDTLQLAAGRRNHGLQPHARVGNKKFRHAVEWLIILFSSGRPLDRTFHLAHHWGRPRFCVVVDASPWGGGALLTMGGSVIEWLSTAWDKYDEVAVDAVIGQCSGQAIWETFIILIALRSWLHVWVREKGIVKLRSDAQAAIGAGRKLRSTRSAGMNRILAELALTQAAANYLFELEFEHIPGVLNVSADSLSRLQEPGKSGTVPPELANRPRRVVEHRCLSWWRTPSGYAYAAAEAGGSWLSDRDNSARI